MIDKEGRLFGKISIIDIVTLVVIVLLASLFFKQLGLTESAKINLDTDTIEIVFYQEEVNEFTAKNVKIGDPAKESHRNISFGEVVAVDLKDSVSWDVFPNREYIKASKEGFNSIKIKTRTKGQYTDNGVILNGEKFYVGETIIFKVGNSIFYGDIAELNKL